MSWREFCCRSQSAPHVGVGSTAPVWRCPPHVVVAADIDLRARIARGLQSLGFAVELASDDERALRLAAERNFLAVIVELGSGPATLPTMLALRDTVPQMIVLGGRPEEIARLQSSLPGIETLIFNKSNDGAVIKQIAEIMNLADSTPGTAPPAASVLRIGSCTVDLGGHIFIDADGHEVSLTRAEAELLQELARNPLQTLSREKLRHAIARRGASHFDQSAEPFDRSIDMLVARLRRKIEPDPKAPQFLLTVPGVGYKLIVRPSAETKKAEAPPSEPERRHITALCRSLVEAMEFAISFDPEDLSRVTKSFQDAGGIAIT